MRLLGLRNRPNACSELVRVAEIDLALGANDNDVALA